MKLSDILMYIPEDYQIDRFTSEYTEKYFKPKGYLVCYKYFEPHVNIACLPGHNDCMTFVIKNPEEVNIEYLYYYLRLNGKLINNHIVCYEIGKLLDVEIPRLPNIEIQNLLVPFIASSYKFSIAHIDDSIHKLFIENRGYLLVQTSLLTHNKLDLNKLCDITDIDMLYKKMSNGRIDKQPNFVKVLDPNIIDINYIQYYLYYARLVSRSANYHFDDIKRIGIPMLSINDQRILVNRFTPIHNEILKLRDKRKANKLELRNLINNIKLNFL